ncbi:MAG: co-chaperone GroES [Salinivirgaceae bacterium]|jgi:chaperonin GroES|nr:co-chaperone GroES [Salinivirgaceae bacterium]
MRELQPINQHVLVELHEETEQQTASGIIIPDSAREKDNTGVVVAISQIESSEISVGEKVMFKNRAGEELDFEVKKYRMLPYADILGKIVETESI